MDYSSLFTDDDLANIYTANKADPAGVNRAIAIRLPPMSYWSGDSYSSYDPMTIADGIRRNFEQRLHTTGHSMSRVAFMKKYGTTFVSDSRGGNAASEVDGQDVGRYYDMYLAPGANGNPAFGTLENSVQDGRYVMPDFGWKYRDRYPYFDAWDYVNPHPESQDLGGFGEFWRQIGRPVATAIAMYFGVSALSELMGGTVAAGGVTATEGLVPLTATTVPSSVVTGVTASEVTTGGLTWSGIQSGISTGNQILTGAKLAQKVTSGQPVSGLDILNGASMITGAGSYLSTASTIATGASKMDLTVSDVSQLDDGTWQYTYSDGSSQVVDSSGTTTTYDNTGALVPQLSTLQAVDVSDNGNGTWTYTFNDGSTTTVNADGSIVAATNQYQQPVNPSTVANPTGTVADSGGWDWKGINKTVQVMGTNVNQALSLISSVRRLGSPPVLMGTTTTVGGVTRTINRNGTVTTRLANGQTTVTGLPTGQAFGFPDGSAVVNNGDGTYTSINADGTTTTGAAPKLAAASGINSQMLMYGGLALLAILALKK
jgi:hypothetical protein